MQVNDRQAVVIVSLVGVAVYYCEWLELITPEFCHQNLQFTLTRMYGVPLLLAGVIGYFGYRKPITFWLIFMLPSYAMRLIQLLDVGGNLSPPLFMFDLMHLILTGLIIAGTGKLKKARVQSLVKS